MTTYDARKRRLVEQLRQPTREVISLRKDTSNLFRDRKENRGPSLDVRNLRHVLDVDSHTGIVTVEGMTPYVDLVDATLPHGRMPAVVPELKSITIGGAVAGVGIESSSFRYGFPHETVLEMEVLLGNGDVVTCTPDNAHRDLFFGMPNSYGTLGYILKLVLSTVPVKPYVRLTHQAFEDPQQYFEALAHTCDSDADFVDGVVFDGGRHYLSVGRFIDEAPYTSDYTYLNIYYRSIPSRSEDYLTVRDYIWRWDTDWFWCSKNLYAQNRLARLLLGRKRLNSVFYTRVMRWNSRWGLTRTLNRLTRNRPEAVIQDVDIPIENAARFLQFFQANLGVWPVWVCPFRQRQREMEYPLYPLDGGKLYVNFGFWDTVANRRHLPPGHFNRLIEDKVGMLGGIKSLYSDSYFSEQDFWRIYNGNTYAELKSRYDPESRLRNLYEKCVLRA
jgi:FAD/FMN-containing dehydrogenase